MSKQGKTYECAKLSEESFKYAVEAFEEGRQQNAILYLCSSLYLIQRSVEEVLGVPHVSESQTEKWFMESFVGDNKELSPGFWAIYDDFMEVVKRSRGSVFLAVSNEDWDKYCKFTETFRKRVRQLLIRKTVRPSIQFMNSFK